MNHPSQFWRYRHGVAVLAILASLPGLFTIRDYHNWHWLAMGPFLLVTLIFLYRRSCTDRVLQFKIYTDMLLIALNFVIGHVPLDLALVTLYVSTIIYFTINLVFFDSKGIQGAILFLLMVPIVRGAVDAGNGNAKHLLLTTVLSIFLGAVTLVFMNMRRKQLASRELAVQDLEMRFQVADSTLRIVQLKERLLIHDCRNLLSQLTRVEIGEAQGKVAPEITAVVLETRKALLEKLDALRDLEVESFRPEEHVRRLVALTPPGAVAYEVHIPRDLVLQMETHLFESIVYNLCRNAWEAWLGQHDSYGGFRFSIRWDGASFLLEDNAGGFDPAQIRSGFTTKEKGNGQFLHTLLQHQTELGVGFSLSRGTAGMVAKVTPPARKAP